MCRQKSLLVHVWADAARCTLVNFDEEERVSWNNTWFRSLRHGGCYDYLRASSTGKIVGVELDVGNDSCDKVLAALPGFEKIQDVPGVTHLWRFWLIKEPAVIQWEQILTENPFLSEDGEVLLLLQAWHLSDAEFAQLRAFEKLGQFKPPLDQFMIDSVTGC